MSATSYMVWIKDPENLDFEEFYKYLNRPENYFKDSYCDGSDEGKKELKEEVKSKFDQAIEEGVYISDNYFLNRNFTQNLAEFISKKGILISMKSIDGWDPVLIILDGESKKAKKYLENPNLDLEKRFDYRLEYIEEITGFKFSKDEKEK